MSKSWTSDLSMVNYYVGYKHDTIVDTDINRHYSFAYELPPETVYGDNYVSFTRSVAFEVDSYIYAELCEMPYLVVLSLTSTDYYI